MKQWPALPELEGRLQSLKAEHRLRSEPRVTAAHSYSSNDYLGLSDGLGANASRLLGAERTALDAFESELSDWIGGVPTVLSSGYQANMAAIGALVSKDDLVLSDAENHASLVDAIRLSRAQVAIFRHLDLDDALLAASRATHGQRVWCVMESYFSMSAMQPALAEWLPALKARDIRCMLDESHAIGIYGPEGRGLSYASGLLPEVMTFGLGKAFAASAGVICGAAPMRQMLLNAARPLLFSTAPSPILMERLRGRLHSIRASDEMRARLQRNVNIVRKGLQAQGYWVYGVGPIVPVVIGDEELALAMSAALLRLGLDVPAIRYPTVAKGKAILRVNVRANHRDEDLQMLLHALRTVG